MNDHEKNLLGTFGLIAYGNTVDNSIAARRAASEAKKEKDEQKWRELVKQEEERQAKLTPYEREQEAIARAERIHAHELASEREEARQQAVATLQALKRRRRRAELPFYLVVGLFLVLTVISLSWLIWMFLDLTASR